MLTEENREWYIINFFQTLPVVIVFGKNFYYFLKPFTVPDNTGDDFESNLIDGLADAFYIKNHFGRLYFVIFSLGVKIIGFLGMELFILIFIQRN